MANDEAYTLESAHQAIYDHYQWFAREAPGVYVQEVGHLAQLWSIVDYLEEVERM